MMNFKNIFKSLGVLALSLFAVSQAEAASNFYTQPGTQPASGGGVCYVSKSETEAVGSYTSSKSPAVSLEKKATGYLRAFPNFGYKFVGWNNSETSTSYDYDCAADSFSAGNSGKTYYAHFTSGATITDIYLGVNDSVKLWFYNTSSKSWSAKVNETFLNSASESSVVVGGSYSSCSFSRGNQSASKAFQVTVTATQISGDLFDQLSVQDYAGNVYHYRVHVVAARTVALNETITFPANSNASKKWSVSGGDTSIATRSVSNTGSASSSATVTVTGKKAGSTSFTVANYASSTKTIAELGATYTFNVTVANPYYAKVATEVVGGVEGSIGAGWAYASLDKKEYSDNYVNVRSVSGLGKSDLSSTVSGFYIFAFPNMGYKFAGWSKNDPNGQITLTDAYFSSSLSVNSTSKDSANPTIDTYYAHFTADPTTVKDITLAVGDTARLQFYNTPAYTWSLQVVYTNGTEEVVVNLDDTAAHAGGYANYTRSKSNDPSAGSNDFNMYIQATKRSGNDYDQLSIEDCKGHVYHYRVHVVDRRVVEKGESISFPANSFASKTWTKTGGDASIATATVSSGATSSATVTARGVAKGSTSFTVKNYTAETTVGELGVEYTFGVNVVEPWPVEFCQGDSVVIYYHNTTNKYWYLLINGNRVEPGVPGVGTQMTVTLKTAGFVTDNEILGVTHAIGEAGTSDLVVVTDGENFYPYRMAARARRVIGVGESTTMKCSTVATFPWRLQMPAASSTYVDTVFEPDIEGGHSARVTITGKEPGTDVMMYVANFKRDEKEVNAQGAYYTLVTDVLGAPTHKAYISKGVSVEWLEGYPDAGVYTKYKVTPESENEFSASVKATNGVSSVLTRLTVSENAAPFSKQTFRVTDDYTGTNVVKYEVTAYSIMSMAVGQEAPGCLVGAQTPWTVWSSDPVNFVVEPVIYNKLHSGRIQPQAPGDYWMWATNTSDKLSWYAMRCHVYDEHEQIIAMPLNSTTNITISAGAGLNALWTLTTNCTHYTASLDNTELPSDEVTLTIVSGAAKGTHTLTVQNAFHHETIKLFTGADPDREMIYGGAVSFHQNEDFLLPVDCVPKAWTAEVAETGLGKFTAAASGDAGERVLLHGVHPGVGQVIVTTEDKEFVYDVEVLKDSNNLSQVTVGVGYSYTTNLTGRLEGAKIVEISPKMVADAMVVGNTLTINGVQEGETQITLATDTDIFYLPVKVHERRILKYITLVLGENGSSSTYSYTFDRVISYTNAAPDRVSVSSLGNMLTFTPVAEGIAGVTVECFVDGLSESSTLIYHITIVREKNGLTVRDFDQGYLSYGNATSVREEDGDLIFVFDDAESVGALKIPDGYTAKLDILAVGGGGGGGSVATGFGRGGGGGGAGGFSLTENKKLLGGSFGVVVGAGGLALSGEIGGGKSLKGSNGGDSVITNTAGFVVALANGGGGGAAPSDGQYSGDDGGSGGGGSWIMEVQEGEAVWVPGRGGLGVNGQGCDGGTPTETNCGGGGGGAMGNGGDGQTRGPGRYSSLSGESVLYSLGGFGGRSDTATPAAAGQGPGFGGDGGNGGPGGDGGKGTVILRFHKLYKNVLVPIPTTNDLITARFLWEEGTNCVPFQYVGQSFRSKSNSHPYNWEDVIQEVSGTTNVFCHYDETGTNKVGIGYYNFKVQLKEGFAWENEDSAYGYTEKMSYRWVVVEDWNSVDAALEVNKTVWWSDKSNATVRVASSSSPETSGGGTPKVLFLGTCCSSHGLTDDVIRKSLDAILSVADLDYYIYADEELKDSDSLKKGEARKKSSWVQTGVHHSMSVFYDRLYAELIENEKMYDYVVFEVDGARITSSYGESGYPKSTVKELAIASYLAPMYADGKVIWIVDSKSQTGFKDPFADVYWLPNQTYFSSSTFKSMTVAQFQGLIGLFSPSLYTTTQSFEELSATNKVFEGTTYYGGIRNDLQADYTDPDAVTNLLGTAIKVKPFNLYYKDKIVQPAEGLEIQSVVIEVCFKESSSGVASTNDNDWTSLMHWDAKTGKVVYDDPYHLTGIAGGAMSVDQTNNLVSACLSNINMKVFVRYDTHVLDVEGKFCSSEGANYNQETGQYEKNPNDGKAYLAMIDDLGVGIGVEGDAETQVPWRYTAYQIKGLAQNGSIFIAGTRFSTLSCAEGRDVTVYYRGNGGYRLSALKVDSNYIAVGGLYDNSYTFKNLSDHHVVSAVYTPYYGTVTPMGSTNEYDGIAHVPHVNLEGWDATYPTQLRYSITPDGEYYTEAEFAELYSTNRDITCVGDHVVYCRAYAYQPGYGETIDQAGWVWVDTRVVESGIVTITKKPLTMTAVSFLLKGQEVHPTLDSWRGVTIDGLVAGDTVNTNAEYLTYSCPTYEQVMGQYPLYPVKAEGRTDEDLVGINYELFLKPGVVSVEKGAMIFDGVHQFSGLDPEDPRVKTGVDRVHKTYDGIETNLTLKIDAPGPEIEGGRRVFYSYDDGASWTTEVRKFFAVGTNRVWYAVEAGENFEKSVYFWVTNYNYVIIDPRPITIAAASATKRYDTLPLSTNGYAIVAGSLAEGDELVSVDVVGSQTVVGSSPNVASNAEIGCPNAGVNIGGREEDYDITYLNGTLTVSPGALVINGVTYIPGGYVEYGHTGVADVEKTYDGYGTNISVTVNTPASGFTVLFSTNTVQDEVWTWSPDPLYTNAGTYAVHFMVAADNYQTITNTAFVKINPRAVTVKVLDAHLQTGEPLPATWPVAITYTDTGAAVPVDIASNFVFTVDSTNKYDVGTHDLVVTSGEKLQGNYTLTYVKGTLEIDDRTPILYTAPAVVSTYDGAGHTLTVTVTNGVAGAKIQYSLSAEGPWSDDPPVITNASSVAVYFHITSTDPTVADTVGTTTVEVQPKGVTVTAHDAWKYDRDPNPTFTATVEGVLTGEDPAQIQYTLSADGSAVGTYPIVVSGKDLQGNYRVAFVNGTLEIRDWSYPAGPDTEPIPIDRKWVEEKMGTNFVQYATASNFYYSEGQNGMTNWMNYVLGLEPNDIESVIYLDIEPNLLSVTNPTLITCGAKVHAMPLGTLTNVSFRLMRSTSPTGTYHRVDDATDGRFPQSNVPAEFFRVDTRFLFLEN